MTLNDLERQFTFLSSSAVRIVTKRLRLSRFCYKVELYFSYLHVKFDDEIERIPSNSSMICD